MGEKRSRVATKKTKKEGMETQVEEGGRAKATCRHRMGGRKRKGLMEKSRGGLRTIMGALIQK